MFDDHAPNNLPGAGQAPGNLPIGEPEDIFAGPGDTDPGESPAAPPAAPPSAVAAGVLKPKQPAAAPPAASTPPAPPAPAADMPAIPPPPPAPARRPLAPPQAPPSIPPPPARPGAGDPPQMSTPPSEMMRDMEDMYQLKKPKIFRSIVLGVVGLLIVAALFGGIWWVYSAVTGGDEAEENAPAGETDTFSAGDLDDSADSETPLPPTDNTDDVLLFGEPIDTDEDGLSDDEEEERGTNPNNWDSDNDQLSDGDEVLIWNTDPNNSDTDGDSYLDGQEIRSGYSPTGSGRIFEPPTEGETSASTSTEAVSS